MRDIRSLDIAMLRTFDALMRERSVSRAAAPLFLSQPAVSASLKRLRETFGDPLFTREPHGVLPTARAAALAPQVERVLADMARLLDAEQPFDPARSDRIFRIGGSDAAGQLVLPALCTGLAAAGSRIRLHWESSAFATMTERLRKGDLHLAVLPRTSPPAETEAVALYDDRYVVAARHGHPRLAAGVTLDAFCEVPQACLGHGVSALDDLVEQALARAGRRRQAQVAVASFAQIAGLLARTDHAAVLPLRVALAHAEALAHWPLPFELPPYTLYLAWDRQRSGADAGVQWLGGEVRRVVAAALAGIDKAAPQTLDASTTRTQA